MTATAKTAPASNGNGGEQHQDPKVELADRVRRQRQEADEGRQQLRTQADRILSGEGEGAEWDGILTKPQLRKLYPLLSEPVPQHYVEFTPKTEGKPYDSTGLRSVQVQIDRLNDVVGPSCWRSLIHYTQGGMVARAHVVLGNDLERASLDENGELMVARTSPRGLIKGPEADVVAHVEGYGGHKRGSAPGDIYKGSETNALKRVIARLGPGREVYTLDADDDIQLSTQGEYQQPRPQRQPPARQAQAEPKKDPDVELAELLAKDDTLKGKRQTIHEGMKVLGVKPAQQVRELKAAKNERDMTSLEQRIQVAVDTQAAGGEGA